MAAIGTLSQRTSSKNSLQTIWEGTEGTESEPDSASSETNAQEGTEVLTSKARSNVSHIDDFEDVPLDSMKEIWKMFNIRDPQTLASPSTLSSTGAKCRRR